MAVGTGATQLVALTGPRKTLRITTPAVRRVHRRREHGAKIHAVAANAAEALLANVVRLSAAAGLTGEAALVANETPSGWAAGGAALRDSRCQQLRRLGDVLLARW